MEVIGPIGVRQFALEKVCETHAGHKHNYDHTTFVHRGRLKIITDKSEKEFCAGQFADIPAGVEHTLKALEPNTVYYCIFSHRDFDGLVTQEYVGNVEAYR